jgi:hypothetical protein
MNFIGRRKRARRGVGSIIGATFLILILLTGYTFYFLNVDASENYQKTLEDMQELDQQRNKEDIQFNDASFNQDNRLNITIVNTGSQQLHLIWLGIFQETTSPKTQEYYKIDFYIDPAETVTDIGNNTIPSFEGDERVIQLVTELGNTFSYNYPPIEDCGDGAQARIAITGVNSTQGYNPSKWTLLGSTEEVSGSVSEISNNDSSYAVFHSYYSGAITEIEDSVDETCDLYSPSAIGTHSNFSAQKYGPDGVMDTLLESNTGGGSEEWRSPTGYEDPGSGWRSEMNAYDDNPSTYAWTWFPADSWSEYLVLTHSDILCGKIQSLIGGQNIDIDQVEADIYNGTWTNVYRGSGTWWTWTNTSFGETSMTKMRFRFHNNHASQYRWILVYEADFLETSANYELDLEVQWTNIEYGEANEELCIYAGDTGNEDLRVDYWTGSTWHNLLPDVNANDWNNVSVSLPSQVFTIRFRDGVNTSDTSPDSWNIDTVLLHIWTQEDEYTAEVEFTGSSNLEDWTQLVWKVDSCWSIGGVTVTIQFYNYTLEGYSSNGDGYSSYVSDATPDTDELRSRTISLDPSDFTNSTGHWKLRIQGTKSNTRFQMKVDWIEFQSTYTHSGESIPYDTWQWYTIHAVTEGGEPLPYVYVSIYANGSAVSLRDGVDGESILNPGWVRLDGDGRYHLEIRSTYPAGETFILYVVAGSVVGQKTIVQEIQT